jgi:hypothetical protein
MRDEIVTLVTLVTKEEKTATDTARLFGVHPATVSTLLRKKTCRLIVSGRRNISTESKKVSAIVFRHLVRLENAAMKKQYIDPISRHPLHLMWVLAILVPLCLHASVPPTDPVSTISTFYGILIQMFWNNHASPHFHALYAEHEVLINIRTLEIFEGSLPSRCRPHTRGRSRSVWPHRVSST